MKARLAQLLAAFLAVILFTNVVSFTTKSSRYSESYPAVVCPPDLSGQSSIISLTSPKTQIRKTGVSTLVFKDSRTRRFAGSAQATVIDSAAITPLAWQVRSGVWAGGVTCIAPVTSQWFVGGTADVTSKGTLTIVNSGLGRALVAVTVFTESGVQAEQVLAIRANSIVSTQLATLAPGSRSLAIHVTPQTGRVNAFVTDERGRGLQALGGDTVNSLENPSKSLVIPAIPQQTGRRSSLPHTLRVLIPGEVGAEINVEIKSTDGTFSPSGLDGKMIPAGKVIDLPLNVVMPSGKFSLHLSSERPFVASVFTKTQSQGKSDFLWSTPAPLLEQATFASTGLAPLLLFTGDAIDIELELTSVSGQKRTVDIKGSEIATYQVSDRVRAFTIKSTSEKTYGAALVTSKSGFGYLPLVTGSALTRTSIPRSNIRVLIP